MAEAKSSENATLLNGSLSMPKVTKFSDFIATPPVEIVVGLDDNKKRFFLHEGLLCSESEKFTRQLKGPWMEATEKSINGCDEDPELFGFFVEYIYRDGWVLEESCKHDSEYILLARLYSMGERLDAKGFQKAVLWKFARSFNRDLRLPEQGICDLLEVTCELPERIPEDPLRELIFWYAAWRLEFLQKYSMFPRLLLKYPDIGRHLCMRADNSSNRQPDNSAERPLGRFQPEDAII